MSLLEQLNSDEVFMKMAYQEALTALEQEEVPVGAVVVCRGKVIGKGHNQTEKLTDVTAHAEMLALTAASNSMGSKFLEDCVIYITLEPCLMCASALRWARIGRVVYGASDSKFGYSRMGDGVLHPKTEVRSGVMSEECAALLTGFFKARRNKL